MPISIPFTLALLAGLCQVQAMAQAQTLPGPGPNKLGSVVVTATRSPIKLSDVLISSFQTGGGGSDQPMDQVSLNFAKVEIAAPGGKSALSIDSRPSDAIALALRADAPIYVAEDVLVSSAHDEGGGSDDD